MYEKQIDERDRHMEEGTLFAGYIKSKKIEEVMLIPTANLWLLEHDGAAFSDLDLHNVRRKTKAGRLRWSIEKSDKVQWADFRPHWIERQIANLKKF